MRTSFLIPFPSPNAKKRVAVFHHAGGSGLSFLRLAKRLQPELELRLAEIPGRGASAKESPPESILEFAAQAAREILLWGPGPLVIYGHSMGAIVAYEVVKALAGSGLPEKMVVSACRPPGVSQGPPEGDELTDERLQEVIVQYGTLLKELSSPEARAYFFPQLRTDLSLLQAYPKSVKRVDVPILAIAGSIDPGIPAEQVKGWGDYTQSGFEFLEKPGGHFFMWEDPTALDQIF